MPVPAIRVDNLSKQYQLGRRETGYATFRDAISGFAASPFRRFRRLSGGGDAETFWALRDVSLEIQPGEVIGVIGRNGAGKSTLLKVLSQITEPTAGRIEIEGRVASLLEVGTGFHPELSGRENVFLNGAILGMTRAEIKRKFDEIAEFSGVEKFLDTPIKRYSSGMQVRLAFAVAAHLEPEILIIDEVLAVGDAAFQERCLKKMDAVATSGRTVLFVSHQMQAVSNLCHAAIELRSGRIHQRGEAREVVNRYLAGQAESTAERRWDSADAPGDEIVRLLGIRVLDRAGTSPANFSSAEPIFICLEFECFETPSALCLGFDLFTADGSQVLRSYQTDSAQSPRLARGSNVLRCEIEAGLLNGGDYLIAPRAGLHNVKWSIHEDGVVRFRVALSHGETPFWNSLGTKSRPGAIAPVFAWERC